MKKIRNVLLTFSVVIFAVTSFVYATESVSIDHTDIIKVQKNAPLGENLNFLLSSDKNMPRLVSMKARVSEMKLSLLRFPYGALGDNYLFTDAPFNDGAKGLTPRVATLTKAPGNYYWAVDDNGYFRESLDFDEYMSYIDKTKAEPLIMVNMLSYEYEGSVVTFNDLITHATEWVKYANVTRGYNIKYWQLGNEVASHTDKDTYIANYVIMAKALKAIDPNIQIGFGEDGRANWLKTALADPEISQYIDFISPHQYLHNTDWTESYESWKNYTGSLTPKIDKFQKYLDTSKNHKNVPMIITEFGSTGGRYAERDPVGQLQFKALKNNTPARTAGFIGLTDDGTALTKSWSNKLTIEVELLGDSWMSLKLVGDAPGYVKAPSDPTKPLSFCGSLMEEGTKWRLLEKGRKKGTFYLESKRHSGLYVTYDTVTARFSLSTDKIWKAENFKLVELKPNLYFPKNKNRQILSTLNKKIVGVNNENVYADLYRSTSNSYQFVMKSLSKRFGAGTVTLSAQDGSDGFIIRGDGEAVLNSTETSENNQLWVLKTTQNTFQLHAYGDANNYMKVNADGSLSTGGNKANKETKFVHLNIPVTDPIKPTEQPAGNFSNDLWKSLVFADMALGTSLHKNVHTVAHWNSQTSWEGKYGGYHHLSNSLENNDENSLMPVGQVMKIINSHTLDSVLNFEPKQGFLRVYATLSNADGSMSIIVLNKNDRPEKLSLDLGTFTPNSHYQRIVFTGTNPEDEWPLTAKDDDGTLGLVLIAGSNIQTTLKPLSLTVIRLNADKLKKHIN